jgi:DNA-binding NtrC family response regulator
MDPKLSVSDQRIVNVLLVSQFEEDHRQFEGILRRSKWRQHDAYTQSEALDFLRENPTGVVLSEARLPDGSWKNLYAQLLDMPKPPTLIVISRLADEQLWSEVLNLGAYNVLAKPLDASEVFHVVSYAWMLWKNQWERTGRCLQAAAA